MMGLSGGENPQTNPKDKQQEKEIYLAGGCFWGTEHFLKQIEGVKTTQVEYTNGNKKNPTYQEVCRVLRAGHAIVSCQSPRAARQAGEPRRVRRRGLRSGHAREGELPCGRRDRALRVRQGERRAAPPRRRPPMRARGPEHDDSRKQLWGRQVGRVPCGGPTLPCTLDRIFDNATVLVARGPSFRGAGLRTYAAGTAPVAAKTQPGIPQARQGGQGQGN